MMRCAYQIPPLAVCPKSDPCRSTKSAGVFRRMHEKDQESSRQNAQEAD